MTSQIAKVAIALVAAIAGISGSSSAALAGEGGVAGGAAFTIDNGNVTGVAVSAAVGKEGAAAGAFNYAAGDVANSAFAVGNAGAMDIISVGSPAEFGVATFEDTARGAAQNNSFTSGFNVQLGTTSGDDLATSPAAEPAPVMLP